MPENHCLKASSGTQITFNIELLEALNTSLTPGKYTLGNGCNFTFSPTLYPRGDIDTQENNVTSYS
jgi:hypothetical protein